MKRGGKRWIVGTIILVLAGLTVLAAMESRRPAPPPPAETGPASQSALAPPSAIGKGKAAMIDLGATECIPCKMMAPIIEELKSTYAGKAEIGFIDVWKYPEQARRYGVQAIPTQIFFDSNGKEVFRHVGFLDKQSIVEILTRLGVS